MYKKSFYLLLAAVLLLTACSAGNSSMQEASGDSTPDGPFSGSGTTEDTGNAAAQLTYDGIYPEHEPYGTGIGAMPGRVVWAYNTDSVEWDGSGYWWEPEHFDEAVMREMVNDSIASLGGQEYAQAGWQSIFEAHRRSRELSGGYTRGEKKSPSRSISMVPGPLAMIRAGRRSLVIPTRYY